MYVIGSSRNSKKCSKCFSHHSSLSICVRLGLHDKYV